MAQKAFPSSNIYDMLRLTSQSRASDPRDRLFGILGLIQHDHSESQIWKPNYSLSAQHVFIGVVAHLIINLKMAFLLRYAAGFSAPASSPSWMPDWGAPESWQRIFKVPESSSEEIHKFVSQNVDLDFGYIIRRLWLGSSEHFSPEWIDTVLQKKPWYSGMVVDINTAALSVKLIHLSTISFRPVLVRKRGKLGLFEVKGKKIRLYLAAEGNVESTGCPGVGHLFMLLPEGSVETYLILRKLDGNQNYKLIASCGDLFIAEPPISRELTIHSLYSEIEKAWSWFEDTSDSSCTMLRGFLPGITSYRDFMPAYRAFLDEQNGSGSNFEMSYLACIGQEFRPHISDGFLELSILSSAFMVK
jgi:hypothetical protein